jgi:hypothetical protein
MADIIKLEIDLAQNILLMEKSCKFYGDSWK